MEKTIEIPEGYEARIEGSKIILEPKESEDERIRKAIESITRVYGKTQGEWIAGYDMDTLVVHLRDAFACLEKQKEQKPESCDCSRDEESYTNGIHHVLMNPEAYGLIKQKPTEWSDVEKMHLANAILAAEKEWGVDSYTVKFLESLRPSWKPSEEQMEALKDAFRKDGGNEYRKVINSLYCDLEKLL